MSHYNSCILYIVVIFVFFISLSKANMRVAVVTGANKGIGFEISKKLCEGGIKTILACRTESLGVQAVDTLRSLGYEAEYKNLDISDEESIASFAEDVRKDYGKLDILVNNAAIAFKGSDPTPFIEQADKTIQPNFFGTLKVCQALIPLLQQAEAPRLINVASESGHLRILRSPSLKARFLSESLTIEQLSTLMNQFVSDVQSGVHAEQGWPNTNYGMSKLGVIAVTKVLARSLPSMQVNACCPGHCATDMSSHTGARTSEQGARTPAWLATTVPHVTNGGPTGLFFSDEVEIEW